MKNRQKQSTDSDDKNFHFFFAFLKEKLFDTEELLIHFACESELNIVPPIIGEKKDRIGTSKVELLRLK